MRESIGGAWLFGIVAVFVFLFAGFLAYAISYTKAFNIKNSIISLIEENEGYSVTGTEENPSVETKAFELIDNAGYAFTNAQGIDCGASYADNLSQRVTTTDGGYCVIKYCPNPSMPSSNTRYKIITYIALKLPIINVTVKIPISGETRTIYSDPWGYSCATLDED